jgi:signal transduction histidine kinase
MQSLDTTGPWRRSIVTIGLVIVSLTAITLFDLVIYPGHNVTALYTIPVLICALRASPRVLIVVAFLSIVIDALDAVVLQSPLERWLIPALVLTVVDGFAALIAWQRQRLAQETRALAMANARLQDLEREREAWTSIIAHDLRQPVTVIVGYADLLVKQTTKQAPRLLPPVEHIRASAHRLNRLIADLADVSRIAAQRFSVEKQLMDLPLLLRSTVERSAATMPDHPVCIEVRATVPPLAVDPQRIEQVLDNLLSNAGKYSSLASAIEVQLDKVEDWAVVSVINEGPGIPPEELSALFSRFYRTQGARTGSIRGLGLGLFISKGIVEAHGGRIWAESVPGATTQFRFTLPLPPAVRPS